MRIPRRRPVRIDLHAAQKLCYGGLKFLSWKVGERIRREVLREKRAGYGEEILQSLSAKLETELGRGFSARNLANMVCFAEVFPDREIVVSLIRELTWTHFIALIPLKGRVVSESLLGEGPYPSSMTMLPPASSSAFASGGMTQVASYPSTISGPARAAERSERRRTGVSIQPRSGPK